MSDFSALPVALEFTDILCDSAVQTLVEYLKANNTPQSVIDLIRNIETLGYYQAECYRAPEQFKRERSDRLDIEMVVIETVNAIAQLGGEFQSKFNRSIPRELPKPAKVRKA